MVKIKYKVSVCVPVYNMERYLEECIDSLVAQSLKSIELVFVNDGSTDRSLEILDKYAREHSNIVIVNQKNEGLGGARNKGIDIASGEYIGFVDADDKVSPYMYEKLLDAAEASKAEIAMCDVKIFPEGKKKNKWYKPFKGVIDADFLHKNTQPWNKIVKKELLDKINFRFYRKNGDGMFIILMLHANSIVSIDDPLYLYRAGHSSMSTSYKLDNFSISIESCELQIKMLESTRYKESLKDFFEFRMIHILLQAMSVAALLRDRKAFLEYKNRLQSTGYRNNKYVKPMLKSEFGSVKYIGITRILPSSYYISRIITKVIM